MITHARIARGKFESRAVYGKQQTENKLEISQNQENEQTKQSKSTLFFIASKTHTKKNTRNK